MVGWEDVVAAAERVRGVAHKTPVMTSRGLDERLSAQLLLKCESFQRAGAFKIRGAYNAISRIAPEDRPRGVVAFSSGNHAQAVALACRLLGMQATIVMPKNAARVKRAATEGYGARIVEYDPSTEKREEVAREIEGVLIPPFDHPHVVAGQGTVAKELFEEAGALDLLLVPCGGGGLLSGSALAARALAPACRVVGVEPELADDATRSFRTGVLQTVSNPRSEERRVGTGRRAG